MVDHDLGRGRGTAQLAAQVARFGELAGRALTARASAAQRACPPLTPAEQQEMIALRAAITGADLAAASGGAAAEGQSGHASPPRPPRLRHRPSPGPAGSAGRHHRPVGTGHA
jgi:hypothetical protein